MKDNNVLDVKFSGGITDEPVSLAEAKAWIKVDDGINDDDDLIVELITTARIQCEGYLCVSLIARSVEAILNNSLGGIELPYGPVNDFTSLKDENDQTINAENYTLQGLDFKTLKSPCSKYLKAKYTAGYADVPTHFKEAVLQQVTHLYENRGDNSQANSLSEMAKQTLKPYCRRW